MDDLKTIKNKRQGTLSDDEKVAETRTMYDTSRDNLNDVIEVMDMFDISIEIAEKCRKSIQMGLSEARVFKKFEVSDEDTEIIKKYIKYASSTDWNEFALKTLGEL